MSQIPLTFPSLIVSATPIHIILQRLYLWHIY